MATEIICGQLKSADLERLLAHYEQPEDLRIIMSCTGAEPDLMLAMAAAVCDYPGKVTIHAVGWCASAGVPVLACAEERIAHPWTQFLVHGADKPHEAAGAWRNAWQAKLLGERTTQPSWFWMGLLMAGNKPRWFTAEEALGWRLVHRIEELR